MRLSWMHPAGRISLPDASSWITSSQMHLCQMRPSRDTSSQMHIHRYAGNPCQLTVAIDTLAIDTSAIDTLAIDTVATDTLAIDILAIDISAIDTLAIATVSIAMVSVARVSIDKDYQHECERLIALLPNLRVPVFIQSFGNFEINTGLSTVNATCPCDQWK